MEEVDEYPDGGVDMYPPQLDSSMKKLEVDDALKCFGLTDSDFISKPWHVARILLSADYILFARRHTLDDVAICYALTIVSRYYHGARLPTEDRILRVIISQCGYNNGVIYLSHAKMWLNKNFQIPIPRADDWFPRSRVQSIHSWWPLRENISWWPHRHTICVPWVKHLAAALRVGSWHMIDIMSDGDWQSLPWLIWGAEILPYVSGAFLDTKLSYLYHYMRRCV